MSKIKLFFVGGFLGSGKTTAIQQAAKVLRLNKKKVGVITNDQGTQQVDTLFIKGLGILSDEISGGCFCCNYNDLENSIETLYFNEQPDIIFAESVGTCTDLAATVINPLLNLNPDQYEIVFSVFADIRLLIKFLQNERDIFYDNVNYIYEKQLEEADIIVVNKIDLLTEDQLIIAKELISFSFENKRILYQNSLSPKSVKDWLNVCNGLINSSLRKSLELDYDIYGAGEAELSWLDEEIGIVTKDNTAVSAGYVLMNKIFNKITEQGFPIGHLKFLIDNGNEQQKISFTSIFISDKVIDLGYQETDRIIILINARIQAMPDLIQKIVAEAITETEISANCKIIENKLSAFNPGYPKPTHRMLY